MIVFGTNFTTDFNDNVTWKPWRMCSGRKWRVEVLAVPGGHLGGIQHCERSVCVSRPNGTWVPGGTQKDAQWQSRFPQEVGPFIGLLGSQLHVLLHRSFSAAALVPVLPPRKGPEPSWRHVWWALGTCTEARRRRTPGCHQRRTVGWSSVSNNFVIWVLVAF